MTERELGLCECAIWLYVKIYSFKYSMGTVCVCVRERESVCVSVCEGEFVCGSERDLGFVC